MRLGKYLLAAALAATAMPASAQQIVGPDRNATGEALILVPLSLTKVDDLDFGTVVSSPIAGTVAISPVDGSRTVGGGVTAVLGDPGFRALFAGAGSPSQQVLFTLTPPATLDDGLGNSIPINLVLEANSLLIDPVTRAFFVGVGGDLAIAADQPEGVYSGIFNLMAEYQ